MGMTNWKRLYTDASRMLDKYQNEVVPNLREQLANCVEVVHGEWTVIENDYDCTTTLECSVCEMSFCFEEYDGLLPQAQTYHYCPNCGAHMRDGDGNG